MGQCADTAEDQGLEMETVDDLGVVTLSADAFIDLDPEHRVLAHHLSRAVAAASAIEFSQRSRFGLLVKEVAEELALHKQAVPEELGPKVETFVRRVFVHRGVHDGWTQRKLAMPLDESEFRLALRAVYGAGAKLPGVRKEADLNKLLNDLQPALFDANVEPTSLNTAAQPEHLKQVLLPLREASKQADATTRAAIGPLISYLESGTPAALEREVRAPRSPFLLSIGPVSSHGFWAGTLMIEDAANQSLLDKLASTSFDLRGLPVEALDTAPARAGIPLTFSGAVGTSSFAVNTVVASDAVRTWVAFPILDAMATVHSRAVLKAFLPDPEREADFRRCLPHAYRTHAVLKHVVGRSLRPKDTKATLPPSEREVIQGARAELLAMVASWDPKLVESGWLPDASCVGVMDALVPIDHMLGLRAIPTSRGIDDPELKASSLIAQAALAKGVLREVSREGHVHLQIVEQERWRVFVLELASELLEIEGKGDGAAARSLIARHGQDLVPRWRDSSVARAKDVGLPSRLVFLAPRLKALRDGKGAITDATLVESLGIIETALVDAGKLAVP